ncbi:MAG: hypothetical protein BGO43_09455 [Gammaproteobacteria bacterium 39-13]|nr:hypothetical protein [Gammaproteobacteria bacterium]OJV93868.1 MAG: hypothetical protein BGO43_09455 [Gammaproteobacteria bacterium 39-13]
MKQLAKYNKQLYTSKMRIKKSTELYKSLSEVKDITGLSNFLIQLEQIRKETFKDYLHAKTKRIHDPKKSYSKPSRCFASCNVFAMIILTTILRSYSHGTQN